MSPELLLPDTDSTAAATIVQLYTDSCVDPVGSTM